MVQGWIIAVDSGVEADGAVGWLIAAGLALILLLCMSLFVSVIAAIKHERLRTSAPTVKLKNGELTVEFGEASISEEVRNCRVRRGRASRMGIAGAGIQLYCWFPVILIYLPPLESNGIGGVFAKNVIAVGLDAQSLICWEKALLPLIDEP